MFQTFFDALVQVMGHGMSGFAWWQVVLYTLATTHITICAVTIYLHRAQAHRALTLHPGVSNFFRFWLWINTGMITREWVAIHRKHHARCEQDGDPHSPQVEGIKKVLLEGSELYRAEAKNMETLDKYGHGTPDDWMERNVYSRYSWQGMGMMLVLNWLLFGAIGTVVWTVQLLWIPVTAAGIINGLGHWAGYRNFGSKDSSHNLTPWGLIIGGEELHNNHHTYPTSAKFSVKKWEFDLGWMYISALKALRLAEVKKVPPVARIESAKSVDMSTVQTLIAHRYDMMARYARELKIAVKRETEQLRANTALSQAELVQKLQTLKFARRWMKYDTDMLTDAAKADLNQAAVLSPQIAKLLAMREELRQLWERSNATGEQMLEQLKDWCARAEQSGNASLQALALRARSYA
jgi:stearoyl-CoA desaturase (Delta-9 desaturase)